jgi:hypothetical protein
VMPLSVTRKVENNIVSKSQTQNSPTVEKTGTSVASWLGTAPMRGSS